MHRSRTMLSNLLKTADVEIDGGRAWDIRVHDERFFDRVLAQRNLGLGETYMDGWWDCDAIEEMIFRVVRARLPSRLPLSPRTLLTVTAAFVVSCLFNLQSRGRAGIIGERHYDLGNAFFEAMLDPAMQYSCGWFHGTDDLAEAQELKMDLICRKLRLEPGMRLLDIGCGWGGLAKYAAERHGCRVTGVTVSREQQEYGARLCRGLPVEILLRDYREVSGCFDRVVSVGMVEHVGFKNYRRFMQVVHNCLEPHDGLFLCHTIGSNTSRRWSDPWISRYIFPNSMLPSAAQLTRAAEGLFVLEDVHNFGASYDKTLLAWEANVRRAWPRFRDRYGERFLRMWRYYLLSCAGAFRARDIQLYQFMFSRGGVPGGYEPVRLTARNQAFPTSSRAVNFERKSGTLEVHRSGG